MERIFALQLLVMMCEHSHNRSTVSSSVFQTLDELDFDRSIHSAALNGDLQRVKRLLERDSNASQSVDSYGYTALHYASRSGHIDICRTLLMAGAEVDARTGEGKQTSLHRAALCGHQSVVKALLDAGADFSAKDADGETPLDKATRNGHSNVVTLLSSLGVK